MSGSRRRKPKGRRNSASKRGHPKTQTTSPRRRCLRIATRIGVGVAVAMLAPIVSPALGEWPVGQIAQVLLFCVAVALLGFHVVNTGTRIRLGHWRVKRLRRNLGSELISGWGIPILVILAILLLPLTWQKLVGIGVAFSLAWYGYGAIQENIRAVVTEENLRQGLDRFRERQPFRLLGVDEDVDKIAKGEHGFGPKAFFVFWVKPSWHAGLSRARIVITNAMMISSLLAWVAAGHVAVTKEPPSRPAPPKRSARQPAAQATAEGAEKHQDATAGSEGAPPGESTEPCPSLPAYGAPRWAGDILNALYYGGRSLNANPPPGNIGGCTGRAVVVPTKAGSFVYTIGRNSLDEIRSVAAVSRKFGPAIFLAPAAQQVLDLIRHGQAPLGGYPTAEAAGGDVATVMTEDGTYVFVRDAKHVPGLPNVAEPYVELPPTVASAWMGAMHEADSWLWPLTPHSWEGATSFPLAVDSAAEEGEFTVTFEPRSGTAQRDQYRYESPAHPLSQAEIENAAALAR